MKNAKRVVWSEGMFLTPQHFQTQDRFIEDYLQFRFRASHFANWGIIELAVDTESLSNGQFSLQKCRGIMPDGLAFSLPDADDLPASRPIGPHFAPTQEALDVYLGIPIRQSRKSNIALQNGEEGAPRDNIRYQAETLVVSDECNGNEEHAVQVAKGNFRLLFGDELLDGFTTVRVAQVTRNSAGLPVLNPQFVPPCLDLASNEFLFMILRRQIEILSTKSSTLANSRRQAGKGLADFTTSDIANFWLLNTVNLHLPLLKHIWAVRHGHPEMLYVAMLQLAGALCTFSLDNHPNNLPDYDHENLGACFYALDEKIRMLLETVIPTNFIPIPLRSADKYTWSGMIQEDRYFLNSQFFLAVGAKMGVDDLIQQVSRRVKVAATADIQRLVTNALPGITLRHTPVPPSAIPMKLDNQYFQLNQSGPMWGSIVNSRTVSVFVPSEIPDAKMELFIVLE